MRGICPFTAVTVLPSSTTAGYGTVDSRGKSPPERNIHDPASVIYPESRMASYRDLLQRVKEEIGEVDAPRARELIESDSPAIVDVRERDEWDEGHLPGAIHIPRGFLESRIEQAVPDRSKPVLLYCAAGNRSAFAAQTLNEL